MTKYEEEYKLKKKLIDFLKSVNKMRAFLEDSFASGYDVKTVNKMVATIKPEALLDDGIIIHKEKQRTDTNWIEISGYWREHLEIN